MAAVTLEAIKERQDELAQMISAFEAANEPSEIVVPQQVVTLRPGERYAGIILGDDGMPSHHLVLLPGEADEVTWKDAQAWAEQIGGELPHRCEQALLFANLRDEFENAWYWSNAQHASDSDYAWCQDFGDGDQDGLHKNVKLRARAVRRLTI